jgi:hypothetical protein
MVGGVLGAALITSGCGAVDDAELEAYEAEVTEEAELAEAPEFDELGAAFSSSSCATDDRDKKYTGSFNHTSPRDYNSCYKGYIVELHDILHYYTDEGTGGGSDGSVDISWGDNAPTKSECSKTELSVYLYKRGNGAWNLIGGKRKKTGYWVDKPSGGFDIPGTYGCLGLNHSFEGLTEGADYRFAVTGRINGSTRKVHFETNPAIHLR